MEAATDVQTSARPIEAVGDLRAECAAVARPSRCVFCDHARVWFNGWRVRSATVLSDAGEPLHVPDLRCRRVKCAACKASWLLYARALWPRRHFQPCVVAQAAAAYLHAHGATLTSAAAGVGCARRTVGRWLHWLASHDLSALARRLTTEASAPVLPARLRVMRTPTCDHRAATLAHAAETLAFAEALTVATGAEPPGLRLLASLPGDARRRSQGGLQMM